MTQAQREEAGHRARAAVRHSCAEGANHADYRDAAASHHAQVRPDHAGKGRPQILLEAARHGVMGIRAQNDPADESVALARSQLESDCAVPNPG